MPGRIDQGVGQAKNPFSEISLENDVLDALKVPVQKGDTAGANKRFENVRENLSRMSPEQAGQLLDNLNSKNSNDVLAKQIKYTFSNVSVERLKQDLQGISGRSKEIELDNDPGFNIGGKSGRDIDPGFNVGGKPGRDIDPGFNIGNKKRDVAPDFTIGKEPRDLDPGFSIGGKPGRDIDPGFNAGGKPGRDIDPGFNIGGKTGGDIDPGFTLREKQPQKVEAEALGQIKQEELRKLLEEAKRQEKISKSDSKLESE